MSWLATWIILELIGVGTASDLSEPQAFKNVSLQNIIHKTSTFRRIFHKNCAAFEFLTFDMNGKVEAEAVPFYHFQLPLPFPQKFAASTASASSYCFRFYIPGYNITKCCILPYKNIK